jgi:adenylosuccinate synthase
VYEEHKGWGDDIAKVTKYEDLPQLARDYVERIEDLAGVPIRTVSVGPSRAATLTTD